MATATIKSHGVPRFTPLPLRRIRERKALLRSVMPRDAACVLYVDHLDGAGRALFRARL